MSNIMVKRAVSLAAAFSMIFVLLLGGMKVEATSITATATVTPGTVTAGERFVLTIKINTGDATFNDSKKVTVSGLGGLSGSFENDSVSFTAGEATFDTDSGALSYNGSGTTSVFIDIAGVGTTSASITGFQPTEIDDGGGGGTVTPSTPTGNLIGVKSGTALPEIKAGETKTIEIPLTSTGLNSRYAGKTQVTATLPEGIYFNTATSMQELNFSRTGKEQTLKLSISADSAAKSGVFPITLKSVYKYSGQEVTEELQINLKVNGKTETEENGGLSVIDYSLDKKSVKAGAGFKLTLTVKNTGNTECQNVKVLLDGLSTDGITVNGGMDTQNIPSLTAGSSVNVSYDLLTYKEMTTGNHILTATASCGEITGSSKVFVPVDGKAPESSEETPKASKPRVVIDSYTFANIEDGEVAQESASSVEGGKTFRLTLNMKNTSTATPIENLKMTITSVSDDTTGGVFTPANASNTFFITKVAAGESFTEVIDLLVKADAPPKSYGLQVAVSYEAVVDKERVTVDDTETITIPVTQPDRFEVEEVNVWGPVMFGETITPNLSYVNKGKSSIYNLTIKVEGTNFTTGESTNYVGNVESGSGDYYEASLNAEAPGTVEGKFIVSYEDAAGNLKELERPFSVEVQEMNWDDDPSIMDPVGPIEPEKTGLPMWAWIVIGVGGAAVIAAAVIVIIKVKKKKAAKKQDEEDDYDD